MTAGTTTSAANPTGGGRPDMDQQYVTIGIDKEIFAFDVRQVCEVLDVQPFTRLPNMPAGLRGMIDHGKRSIPVFDMRVTFGLPPAEPTPKTRIVVLEVPFADRPLVVGVLTDQVYEVTALDSGEIEEPPDICVGSNADAVIGLGRRRGQIVIILDATKVFSATDLSRAIGRGRSGGEDTGGEDIGHGGAMTDHDGDSHADDDA